MSPEQSLIVEVASGELLPEIAFALDDFVDDEPIAFLEVELVISTVVDRKQLPKYLARFVRAVSLREADLGGMGMILDSDGSRAKSSSITLQFRSLDVRHSYSRLQTLAVEFRGMVNDPSRQLEQTDIDRDLVDQVMTEIARNLDHQGTLGSGEYGLVYGIKAVQVRNAGIDRGQVL